MDSSTLSLLTELCNALGWQGGTRYQALAEVERLVAAQKPVEAAKREGVDAGVNAQLTQPAIPLLCNGGECHKASTCPSGVLRGSIRCAEHRAGA